MKAPHDVPSYGGPMVPLRLPHRLLCEAPLRQSFFSMNIFRVTKLYTITMAVAPILESI